MKRKKKFGLGLLLSLIVAIMAGCQAVNGVDLNNVLLKSTDVHSYESTESVHLQLLMDDSLAVPEEAAKLVDMLKDITVTLDQKVADATQSSASGTLTLGKVSIPFELYTNGTQVLANVGGTKHPLLLSSGAVGEDIGSELSIPVDASIITEQYKKMIPLVVKQMPNPKKLNVSMQSSTIHGESVFGAKVHAEIKGSELTDWLTTFITNLVSDEESFKSIMKLVLTAQMAEEGTLSDEELATAIDEAYTEAKGELPDLISQLKEELSAEEVQSVLNDDLSLSADLFVDSHGDIRKSNITVNMKLPADKTEGLNGIILEVNSEKWNVNQTVKVDPIDAAGALEIGPSFNQYYFLKNLEPTSPLYSLLTNDLKATDVNLHLLVMPNAQVNYQRLPYLKKTTTMVPVRLAEDLGGEVTWDAVNKQIVITDILSGKVIALKEGSNTAVVDGKPVQMAAPVETVGGRSFVPAKFLATEFGCKLIWHSEDQSIEISRP
ncbi:copper amine oxidase N-terminal domain-containing protein [Gorillibacterium massiliense]|uniref:copper amine oxidase N-terminal domain-containing protein n=1 Tax=Gorillibacterium massiliense TaxID=1280390 RepID=UPI0004BAC9F1|nr:copper amine oxidase N-terminal domain-containing protein [Gorillibacterium massiliense]